MDDNEMRKRLWDSGWRQYGSSKVAGSEGWAIDEGPGSKDRAVPLRAAWAAYLGTHTSASYAQARSSIEEHRWGGWTINFKTAHLEYWPPNIIQHRATIAHRVYVGHISCAMAVLDHAVELAQKPWGGDDCVGDFIRVLDDLFRLRETMLEVQRSGAMVDLVPVLATIERQRQADLAAAELRREDAELPTFTPWSGSRPNLQNIPRAGGFPKAKR